ncbi:putative peptide maturation dehydrogenase [Massilia pseudoviolaceinigra]|uniref:putative peptide maturation dehydrogenase n=1 Tax=Massilia pseudoviolaceinigra TaxID=3057165 RepID=UPI0027968827|nr:putative peptide maturation dehydrogenase [Massilia sp. CCM 9206]MDQ1923323.1 putative peptide maturation dehydrogenase [Massilia sp. CCM 9206]
MKIRRCAVLFIEPREDLGIDWTALFSGAGALSASLRWVALAPHLDRETTIDTAQVAALGAIGQTAWTERLDAERQLGAAMVDSLLALGLLLDDGASDNPARERDALLRDQHWRPLSAAAHMFSRWDGMQVDKGMHFPSFEELVQSYGAPPAPAVSRGDPEAAIKLPPPSSGPLDAQLMQRYTGRNYDPDAVLPLDVLARLLQRTFGVQAERMVAQEALVFKKTSPSAGGLHPTEAYVLVQRVPGVAPGLYHYHALHHALEPLTMLDAAAASEMARQFVADQHWFVDAPVMVVMAARVARNFWKYRNHAKAYRALMLDAGHLSQTFYLLATEAGMPGFVTAAINEMVIERAFGLDPLSDAVVAVCGCGVAAAGQTTLELRFEE